MLSINIMILIVHAFNGDEGIDCTCAAMDRLSQDILDGDILW